MRTLYKQIIYFFIDTFIIFISPTILLSITYKLPSIFSLSFSFHEALIPCLSTILFIIFSTISKIFKGHRNRNKYFKYFLIIPLMFIAWIEISQFLDYTIFKFISQGGY